MTACEVLHLPASAPDKLQQCLTTAIFRFAEKCVTKPSTSLGSSEQQCIARCADRYSEVRKSRWGRRRMPCL